MKLVTEVTEQFCNKSILLIFLFILLSCGKRSDFEYTLCGKKFKYWDLMYGEDVKFKVGAYRFGIDQSCFYYLYDKRDGLRKQFSIEDRKWDNTWVSSGDSVLRMDFGKLRILKMNEDSLLLYSLKGDSIFLIKSLDQSDSTKNMQLSPG